jgi:hypothetical protein
MARSGIGAHLKNVSPLIYFPSPPEKRPFPLSKAWSLQPGGIGTVICWSTMIPHIVVQTVELTISSMFGNLDSVGESSKL